MKYFLYRIKGGIKNISQIKTKQISKRGKIAPQKRVMGAFNLKNFFATFFKCGKSKGF